MNDEESAREIIDGYIYRITGMTPFDRSVNLVKNVFIELSNTFQEFYDTNFNGKEWK